MRMCGSGRRNGLPGRTKKLRDEKWIGPLRHPLDKIRPIQAAVCAGDPRWSRLFSGDSHDVENVVGVIDARTALAIKNPRGTPGSSILRSTKGTTNAGNLLPLGP